MKREAQLKTVNGRAFAWNIIRQKFGSLNSSSVGFISAG
jgi:hypothetical protein